jgi:hypothetical protein
LPERIACETTSFCTLEPDCIPCRAKLPDGSEGNSTCVYSPRTSLCMWNVTGAPVNYTLVGHGLCPYPVSNYSAMAFQERQRVLRNASIPTFIPQAVCVGCDADMSSVLEPLAQMPSMNWTETPRSIVLEQSVCRYSNRVLCPRFRNQSACEGVHAGCLWCPGFRPGSGRCSFAPEMPLAAVCQLGEEVFPRKCSTECEPDEATCPFNLNEADCKASAASVRLGREQQGCRWCSALGRCTGPRRCTFAGEWQYDCEDVSAPSTNISVVGIPSCSETERSSIARCANLPPSQFCNDVPECHLCMQPRSFPSAPRWLACGDHRPVDGAVCRKAVCIERDCAPITVVMFPIVSMMTRCHSCLLVLPKR